MIRCIKANGMGYPTPTDTIAAIATAPGEGAIAIIRISGAETFELTDRIFRCPPPRPSQRAAGTFVHGEVVCPTSAEVLDEALLLIFRAPHSYTGEDSVEIQCHGGTQPARRILECVFNSGARQAEPGEFTKRAFLNGRMDLTQAEAVLDLIHASSERAAKIATAQLENSLGRKISSLYHELLSICADTEAMLDFPDDELPQSVPADILKRLHAIYGNIKSLLSTWQEGHILREGARIVIAGAPNVGKSSLLNLLSGRDRAIVSPYPGTTRDTIEEYVTLRGYPIHLVDTAGLRDAPCEIENEGIRRAKKALATADLCICLVDASKPLSQEESTFITSHPEGKILVFLNKIDLGQVLFPENFHPIRAIPVSLLGTQYLDLITESILDQLLPHQSETLEFNIAVSSRHRKWLSLAANEIDAATKILEKNEESNLLLAADQLRHSIEHLGFVLGKNCTEEMLNEIFSRFCVGK